MDYTKKTWNDADIPKKEDFNKIENGIEVAKNEINKITIEVSQNKTKITESQNNINQSNIKINETIQSINSVDTKLNDKFNSLNTIINNMKNDINLIKEKQENVMTLSQLTYDHTKYTIVESDTTAKKCTFYKSGNINIEIKGRFMRILAGKFINLNFPAGSPNCSVVKLPTEYQTNFFNRNIFFPFSFSRKDGSKLVITSCYINTSGTIIFSNIGIGNWNDATIYTTDWFCID